MKLGGLLPIHAVRERRAQRLHYEQSQAYERALSAQMLAAAAVERLQRSYQTALSSALDGSEMSAAYAQALLEQAVVAQRGMAAAQKELDDKQTQMEQAQTASQEARAHYASKVCIHQKMRELCSLQDSREAKVAEARAEMQADEEFVAPWLARQVRFKGVA